MKTLTILLFLLLAVYPAATLGYTYLQVQDPRGTWRSGSGTIDSALLEVHPKGLFMEQALFLTFSAKGSSFGSMDTLEVQYFFDLPEYAMVTDLWLWIGNEPVKAKLMDSWTASTIYEGIVRRRRDPAILFKRSATQYELRIFPMAGNQTRKIKLTYLSPAQWTNKSVASLLPTGMLAVSYPPLASLSLHVWPQGEWIRPRILELDTTRWTTVLDSASATHVRSDLPASQLTGSLTLAFDSPMQDGRYLTTFSRGNDGWYQLAFTPSVSLEDVPGKKAAIMIDYVTGNSTHDQPAVMQAIRTALHETLVPSDSFNILLGRVPVGRASDHWLPADSTTIDSVLAALGSTPLGGYSNLPAVLSEGINFVKEQGGDGSLLLLANSDDMSAYQAANDLLNDLLELMGKIIPVSVIDFGNVSMYTYNLVGSRYYLGNEYLYVNLARLTGGNFVTIGSNPLAVSIRNTLETISGVISSFDLHTTLQNGFCYGRLTIGGLSLAVPVDKPILQTGMYYGTLPFIIQAAGVYNSRVYSQTIDIPPGEAEAGDSLLSTSWAGMQIAEWEGAYQSNELTCMIIEQSLRHRVLSRYTAFLALEPNDTTVFCATCTNDDPGRGGQVADVVEKQDKDTVGTDLIAYPNPFNASTIIRGRVSAAGLRGGYSLTVYNILGQVVRTFDAGVVGQDGRFSVTWDGRNDHGVTTTSGMYIFVLTTPNARQAIKLLMVK